LLCLGATSSHQQKAAAIYADDDGTVEPLIEFFYTIMKSLNAKKLDRTGQKKNQFTYYIRDKNCKFFYQMIC
jgi:hypothetical protein